MSGQSLPPVPADLTEALAEAGDFLDDCHKLDDERNINIFAGSGFPLTLATIRALYDAASSRSILQEVRRAVSAPQPGALKAAVSDDLPGLPGVPASVAGITCFDCGTRRATVTHEQRPDSDDLAVTITCECGSCFSMVRHAADAYALGLEVGAAVAAARARS